MERIVELRLPERGLLVLAGLPGAGKSTLLRALDPAGPVKVLDSDQVRTGLCRRLPSWVRYRWYRVFVHVAHRARILWFAAAHHGPVLAHEPATRLTTRAMLVLFGVLTRRPRHLVWLASTPPEALRGQQERGRLIRPRSFDRHVRRAAKLERRLRAGERPGGWQSARIVPRPPIGSRLRISLPANDLG